MPVRGPERGWVWRVAVVASVSAVAIWAAASARPVPALAHAVLLASAPADGSVLPAPPRVVSLLFSEAVQTAGTAITIVAPSGTVQRNAAVHFDALTLSVVLRDHERGTYTVLWTVIALDTHPTTGRLTFSVGRRGDVARLGTGGAGIGLPLQILAHWLHALGYALGFGIVAFDLLVCRPLAAQGVALDPRPSWRLMALGVVLLVVAEPLSLAAETATLSLGTSFDPGALSAALASSFGRVLAQRLGAAVLLWTLLASIRAGSAGAAWLGLLVGAALAVVDGEAGHAADVDPAWAGYLGNALHGASAGLWIGGLAALLVMTRPPLAGAIRDRVVARFGHVAAWSAVVVAVSGTVLAWQHVGSVAALGTSAYGRTVVAKALLLLSALVAARLGLTARPERRSRWWAVEATVLLSLLALAALLLSLPPPV